MSPVTPLFRGPTVREGVLIISPSADFWYYPADMPVAATFLPVAATFSSSKSSCYRRPAKQTGTREPDMTDTRRFTRRRKGKVLMGLCAGLGDYFRIDPLIIRLAFLLGFFTLSSGLALIVFYFIAALVVPYGDAAEKA